MKINLLLACLIVLLFSVFSVAQNKTIVTTNDDNINQQTLETIPSELKQFTKSLQTFNQRLNDLGECLNKYKGIQLGEK